MKKRYSNFHRARKWHRKFQSALFSGRIWYIHHYSELYYKYLYKAEHEDDLDVRHHGIADNCRLVVKS